MNIKKIFFIILILFTIISCSDKKEKALEICADSYWVQNEKVPNKLYKYMSLVDSSDKRISKGNEIIESQTEKRNIAKKKLQDLYKKNFNPPPYNQQEPTSIKIPNNYNKDEINEYIRITELQQKSLKKEIETWDEAIKINNEKLTMHALDLLEKNWKKRNIKQKIGYENYFNYFVICEKEYNNAPTAFKNKWLN